MSERGQFRRYDHIERLGHPEVSDIDVGLVHVFPKLDGTNASVWLDADSRVQCGSRNRVLSLEKDNHGFCEWVHSDDVRAVALRMVVQGSPSRVIYGEWLVPHSIKTYRQDAWRRFWVFDVYDHAIGRYVPWPDYGAAFEAAGLDVIHPICTAENPSQAQLTGILEQNTFLVQDGAGVGEGVVIKNFDWTNKYGRQPWAKCVRNEFREANAKAFGVKHVAGEKVTEQEAVLQLATEAFIRKTWVKVVVLTAQDLGTELGSGPLEEAFIQANRGKLIPRFLGTLYHDFLTEEIWTIAKRWKNPALDLGKLNKLLTIRAKAVMAEVF